MTHPVWLDLPVGSDLWWTAWADATDWKTWRDVAREAIALAKARA